MLGQPISMLIPQVLGFRLTGTMLEGATATDLVLTITERLRKHGVVGKFVEFFGPGLEHLTIADRATLGNMCPEYGATIAIFPIDAMTLDYLRLTGRDDAQVALVEAYAKAQGLFRSAGDPDPVYTETIELDLATRRAEPRRAAAAAGSRVAEAGEERLPGGAAVDDGRRRRRRAPRPAGSSHVSATTGGASAAVAEVPAIATALDHGSVVIAAITSCTNTSNPSVMIGAGLVAKKAVERGLTRQPWVKTSLAPGSKVVTEYLRKAGLDIVSRRARLQSRRLRLHDLHRQQRSAARRRVGRSRGAQSRRRLGAERQPQFRRPHPAAGARQLSRVAAAGRRLRAGRPDDARSDDRADRHRQERRAGLPARALADRARDSGDDAARR